MAESHLTVSIDIRATTGDEWRPERTAGGASGASSVSIVVPEGSSREELDEILVKEFRLAFERALRNKATAAADAEGATRG